MKWKETRKRFISFADLSTFYFSYICLLLNCRYAHFSCICGNKLTNGLIDRAKATAKNVFHIYMKIMCSILIWLYSRLLILILVTHLSNCSRSRLFNYFMLFFLSLSRSSLLDDDFWCHILQKLHPTSWGWKCWMCHLKWNHVEIFWRKHFLLRHDSNYKYFSFSNSNFQIKLGNSSRILFYSKVYFESILSFQFKLLEKKKKISMNPPMCTPFQLKWVLCVKL